MNKQETIWEGLKKQIKGIKDGKFKYLKVYQIGKQDGKQERDKEVLEIIEKAVYSPKLDHKRTEEVWILVEELKQALKQNG